MLSSTPATPRSSESARLAPCVTQHLPPLPVFRMVVSTCRCCFLRFWILPLSPSPRVHNSVPYFFISIPSLQVNSFINAIFLDPICMHVCVLSRFSRVQLSATLWTMACQAPLSIGFSRQEYWSGLPFPAPPYICINVQYFSFSDLTSLCVIGSRFIHLTGTDPSSFFFHGWVIFHCIDAPYHLYPFVCRWISRLLPCPGYGK